MRRCARQTTTRRIGTGMKTPRRHPDAYATPRVERGRTGQGGDCARRLGSRQDGSQNGNARDYCTYKRFTVRGPFAEPKGGRGRYGNRQAEASRLPFYFPGCKPSALPSLALSAPSDSVASPCSLPYSHFFLYASTPRTLSSSSSSSSSSSMFPRSHRCALHLLPASFALLEFSNRRARWLIPSVAVRPVGDGISDGTKGRMARTYKHTCTHARTHTHTTHTRLSLARYRYRSIVPSLCPAYRRTRGNA